MKATTFFFLLVLFAIVALCAAVPWRVKGIGSYTAGSSVYYFDHKNVQNEMKRISFYHSNKIHCIIVTFDNDTAVTYGNCLPLQSTISTLHLNDTEKISFITGKNNFYNNLALVYVGTTSNKVIGPMGDDWEGEPGEDFEIVLPEGYYIAQLLGRWRQYSLFGESFSQFRNIGVYVKPMPAT